MSIERENPEGLPIPNVEITVNGELVTLEWDTTEVYTFEDEWFNHIYIRDREANTAAVIFGAPPICEFLIEQGYREIHDQYPTDDDLEWFMQFHAENLDMELENLLNPE